MLAKTSAIILGSVKYGDSSIILKAYTREAGVKSFIAGGVRSKKGAVRPAMVQPLSQLSLVYYERSKGDLKRIKEASVAVPYRHVFYDPVKSSLAMFLGEMLLHLLHEEEPDYQLYDYLSSSFARLDEMQEGLGTFHLSFLYNLTTFLGFAPEKPNNFPYFDLMNGVYSSTEPPHPYYLAKGETEVWKYLGSQLSNGFALKLNRPARETSLGALIEYYRLHVKDFKQLRSLDILKELLA